MAAAVRGVQLDTTALVADLARYLPRLIFAVVDRFPLAGGVTAFGEETRDSVHVPVLAVRSTPVKEHLDRRTIEELRALGKDQRDSAQPAARRLDLQVARRDGLEGCEKAIRVVVSWHDVVDFIALLLRGNPSCVEAMASEDPPLHSTEEWTALRAAFGRDSCTALFAGKSYRMACIGPAAGFLKRRKDSNLEDDAFATLTGLCGRGVRGACDLLSARVASLTAARETRTSEWEPLVTDLLKATSGVPHATSALPETAVHAWADGIRREDFAAFIGECSVESTIAARQTTALEVPVLEQEWEERFGAAWPAGAELVFFTQTGSFMYDLHTEASDQDFTVVFLSPPEQLAARTPPPARFERHTTGAFGSDKCGEVEYSGRELATFLVDLATGNPRNIELLFTEKPYVAGSLWGELRARRRDFLTLHCADQYLKFVIDRLRRARAECDREAGEPLDASASRRLSKLLYHAQHKMLELARVLHGDVPKVALDGDELDFVMSIRAWRPQSVEDARSLIEEAEARRAVLSDRLRQVEASGGLPAHVDVEPLISWLQSVRTRQATKLP